MEMGCNMTGEIVVLVTVPSRQVGDSIAASLVEERLAACVNLVGPITSIYRWEGTVNRDEEHLLIIKSTRRRYGALEERIRQRHPYDLPEVIALPVLAGLEPYLAWVRSETAAEGAG